MGVVIPSKARCYWCSSQAITGIADANQLLVERLRQVWPKTRFIVRGDSGFCRPAALRGFDRRGAHYIIGLPQNAVLLRHRCSSSYRIHSVNTVHYAGIAQRASYR